MAKVVTAYQAAEAFEGQFMDLVEAERAAAEARHQAKAAVDMQRQLANEAVAALRQRELEHSATIDAHLAARADVNAALQPKPETAEAPQ